MSKLFVARREADRFALLSALLATGKELHHHISMREVETKRGPDRDDRLEQITMASRRFQDAMASYILAGQVRK